MADVESTIFETIYNYPGLFRNRTQVLHYLFAMNGTDFDWVDGELVDVLGDEKPNDVQRTASWERGAFDDRTYELTTECLSIRQLAQIRAQQRGSLLQGGLLKYGLYEDELAAVYERSVYAPLLNIPDDIKPDWAAAAEEIRPLIEAGWAAQAAKRRAGVRT